MTWWRIATCPACRGRFRLRRCALCRGSKLVAAPLTSTELAATDSTFCGIFRSRQAAEAAIERR